MAAPKRPHRRLYTTRMAFQRRAWEEHLTMVLKSDRPDAPSGIVDALRAIGWHLTVQETKGARKTR